MYRNRRWSLLVDLLGYDSQLCHLLELHVTLVQEGSAKFLPDRFFSQLKCLDRPKTSLPVEPTDSYDLLLSALLEAPLETGSCL